MPRTARRATAALLAAGLLTLGGHPTAMALDGSRHGAATRQAASGPFDGLLRSLLCMSCSG